MRWIASSIRARRTKSNIAAARVFQYRVEWRAGGCKRFAPNIPWNEICLEQQSEAIKLQRVLLPALNHWKEVTASPSSRGYAWREDATLLSIGLRVYHDEFGARVTSDRWQHLFNRVLQRDGGAAQFHRPELFLSGNLRRAVSAEQSAAYRLHEFPALHDLIFNKFSNPQSPSSPERARLWQAVFQTLQPFSGRELKSMRLRLINFLFSAAPWLAASKNALRVALDRTVARGNNFDGAIEAFADGREERRGIPTAQPYDEEQVKLIKFTAAKFTGNSIGGCNAPISGRGWTDYRSAHQRIFDYGNEQVLHARITACQNERLIRVANSSIGQ